MFTVNKYISKIGDDESFRNLLLAALFSGAVSCTRAPVEHVSQHPNDSKIVVPQTVVDGITRCVVHNGAPSTNENTNYTVTLTGPHIPHAVEFNVFRDRRDVRTRSWETFPVDQRGHVAFYLPPVLKAHIRDPFFMIMVNSTDRYQTPLPSGSKRRVKSISCDLEIDTYDYNYTI